ncbi:hypothetical protein [Pseudoclavibacter terrae]|uniref:hypothetical protein n=1 Tax=Pseudoclavibacter terrae TaxID=1530195 RepID=UPI00232F2667|nr:hypothetical protein [Pseudoclavibacter terrae]
MLGRLEDGPSPEPAEAATPVAEALNPATARAVTPDPPVEPAVPEGLNRSAPTPGAVPKYLRLERKETRLRADQYAALTENARRLNKAKGVGGERITENTLIRIAVDLLLDRAGDLTGLDEGELFKSVSS